MPQLNSSIIISVEDGGIVLYVTDRNKKFKITDRKYIDRIVDLIFNNKTDNNVDKILEKNGVIVNNHPSFWDGDKISLIAHNVSRIKSSEFPQKEKSEILKDIIDLGVNAQRIPERYKPEKVLKIHKLKTKYSAASEKMSLSTVLNLRSTTRNFNGEPISIEHLSEILYKSLHISPTTYNDKKSQLGSTLLKRTSPSSTGLQSCDAFLIVNNVKDIDSGYYFYDSLRHEIQLVTQENDLADLSYIMADQYWAINFSVGIVLTIDLKTVWIKDKNIRGYLSAYLEAGHISQTVLLLATSCGINTWITGSFRDNVLSEKLKISDNSVFPVFFVGLGYGDDSPIPRSLLD